MINGITAIICTHNGSHRLYPTLKALADQNINNSFPCELILVDNASTDLTSDIAYQYWTELGSPYPLAIISEPNPGKANALITGYNAARYELMLLCDDDNWLQPDYFSIVVELYTKHPEIGMLGGYGKALFNPGEKPVWFDKWAHCYVCGKHHNKDGYLSDLDFSIWGAGSVLRKTMWDFLRNNGFTFYNSMEGGKAMTEDAELSMAITFTGHKLYFDERLWFTHDLRGGRVTYPNLLAQQTVNGKNSAIIYMYRLAFNNVSNSRPLINWSFAKIIIRLMLRISKSCLKWKNRPEQLFIYTIFIELLTNLKKYRNLSLDAFTWVGKIKNTLPLSQNNPTIL